MSEDKIANAGSRESLVQPSFDQRVWSVVEQIPHGRLATYGQIADLIGAWG